MIDTYVHHEALMDTVVTVEVVGHGDTGTDRAERANAVARAIEWFRAVEVACSRFDPGSEVGALARRAGQSTPVSPMVFEAVSFAIALAEETDGAFDPTVGALMVARGFNREYRSGAVVGVPADAAEGVSFRDVALDATRRTITLRRALVLDLGAVAKGLAIDLAARELQPFGDFAIDAGGDLYLAGRNRAGARWAVGVRDPRHESRVLETLHVSDAAVCTSGDYARRARGETEGHHIVDPRTGSSANELASVSVIAPTALAADALGTAAFVLGASRALALFARHGVEGLIVTAELERVETPGLRRYCEAA